MRLRLSLAVLILLFSFSPLRAEDETPGSVTGTLTNAAGEKVAGFTIKFYELKIDYGKEIGGEGKGNPSKRSAPGQIEVEQMQHKFGELKVTLQTDKDGKFEIKKLKPCNYRYRAGGVDTFRTIGTAGGTFELAPGEAKVLNIQLAPPQK